MFLSQPLGGEENGLDQGDILHGIGDQCSQTGYKSHRLFEENKESLMILGKIWNFKVVVDYFFLSESFCLLKVLAKEVKNVMTTS